MRIEWHQRIDLGVIGTTATVGNLILDHFQSADRALYAVSRCGYQVHAIAGGEATRGHFLRIQKYDIALAEYSAITVRQRVQCGVVLVMAAHCRQPEHV